MGMGDTGSTLQGKLGNSWRRRALSVGMVLGLAAGSGSALLPGHTALATSVTKTALINGDSVTTGDGITDGSGPISLEQFAAQTAGYTVTVVTGAQWDAMTAAQFAHYQLLIVGDPFCGFTPSSATSNASTWVPVVMGTSGLNSLVGNRTVVGTDPEFHYMEGGGGAQPTNPSDPTTSGAEHLVQDGITFAGGVSGATGIYFDTSCGDSGSNIAVLNSLSAGGSGFTENTSPPCGGSVQIIASVPSFSTLTDSNIQGWGCSDHITYPTYPTDWQPLAVATDTPTHPTCGTDPFTHTTACGESYVLLDGQGITVTAPDLSLTPATHSDPAGGSHTVTASVTQGGSALSGQLVSFAVTGQNAGVSGTCAPVSCLTDAAGNVTFTYSDTSGAGTDTINASVTISGATEHATAAETWTAATAPSIALTPPSASQGTGTSITMTATLNNFATPNGTVVTFTVNGANPQTGSGTANSGGVATYTYSGVNAGTDHVTASALNSGSTIVSNTAVITWTSTHPSPCSATGGATPAGSVNEFSPPTADSGPEGIVCGPDGNLWFTEEAQNRIAKVTQTGVITEFNLAPARTGTTPDSITVGPDGALWFTEPGINRIGRITTGGVITDFKVPGTPQLNGITTGPDGNLWFADSSHAVWRMTTSGTMTKFSLATGHGTDGIVAGPDGNLWFTEPGASRIGKITTSGTVTEFALASGRGPTEITVGPDGNLWFSETTANKIGRSTTGGVVTEFAIPTASSQPGGITAGPDGAVYFTEAKTGKIGRITTAGVVTNQYLLDNPTADGPIGIAQGPCGLWITNEKSSEINNLTSGC